MAAEYHTCERVRNNIPPGIPIGQSTTGQAGGGEFHGNANREVITVPFLNDTAHGFGPHLRGCPATAPLRRHIA